MVEAVIFDWAGTTVDFGCFAPVQALYAPYEERLLSILDNFAGPKPYVLDAVAELRDAGVKIGSTTGYNDKMMAIVEPCAAERGYRPDFSVTPDAVGGHGRPYPYMIFRNMSELPVLLAQLA